LRVLKHTLYNYFFKTITANFLVYILEYDNKNIILKKKKEGVSSRTISPPIADPPQVLKNKESYGCYLSN
jgi:hypothetical protein